MATFSDLFARLDPDPRLRGKQFEHVCKWFLTNDPTYKNTLRRVWLWSEWTGRWGGDAGIDLVAEDHDGRLWAAWASVENGVPDRGLLERTNVNGGAIAIGHPLGASGARIMTTLVNALEQRGGGYGLQTMCEGGGMANATIIERLG